MNPVLGRAVRSSRPGARAGTVVRVLAALAFLVAAPACPAAADPVVSCLDAHLRPASTCPPLRVGLRVALDGDALVVTVRNDGSATWDGEPVAVEAPLVGAEVATPEGTVDAGDGTGSAGWVERAGAVVGRCVFDPSGGVAAGDAISCALPLLSTRPATLDVWFTGFTGGLPDVSAVLGDDPPAVGVVPVAVSRSLHVALDHGEARLVARDPAAVGPSAAVGGSDATSAPAPGRTLPILIGLIGVIAVAGAIWWTVRWRTSAAR